MLFVNLFPEEKRTIKRAHAAEQSDNEFKKTNLQKVEEMLYIFLIIFFFRPLYILT